MDNFIHGVQSSSQVAEALSTLGWRLGRRAVVKVKKAVALRYEQHSDMAPRVVAKGAGEVAEVLAVVYHR